MIVMPEDKAYFAFTNACDRTTKGSILGEMLRPVELAKIDCGREHFKALGDTVDFTVADSFSTFMDKVME